MKTKCSAFTIIELLVVISIILILISLTAGIVIKAKTRSKTLQTEQVFSFIEQALIMYSNATGDFPIINNEASQKKLYQCLINIDSNANKLEITNYKGDVVKTITEPFMNENELLRYNLIVNERFRDAWGKDIFYFYGENITPTSFYNPGGSNYNYSNRSFDLISFGKDGSSKLTDPKTQNNDITNF